ncbi:MAG: hypothetical protein ACK4ZG_01105 [Bacteroidota bacterium]|jgi:hypothetical protein
MSPSDFKDKLEQQVKKDWTDLISSYGVLSLKLYKSMQDVQSQREELLQFHYTLEKVYKAMYFFKSYKPSKNPKYLDPDDTHHPRGSFSEQLKSCFEEYLSHSLKDLQNDVIKFQVYLGGMDADEYLYQNSRYRTLHESIFSEELFNKVSLNAIPTDVENILHMHDEYTKNDAQQLMQEGFEDVAILFGKKAEALYNELSCKKVRYYSEYSDKFKRMIYYKLQVNDLSIHIKKFYFLCLCIFKGKDLDVKDTFEVFQIPEPGHYDYYWWQNDPFDNNASLERDSFDDERYGGFRKVMKSIFKDELTELQTITDSKNEVKNKYLLGRLNFESIF